MFASVVPCGFASPEEDTTADKQTEYSFVVEHGLKQSDRWFLVDMQWLHSWRDSMQNLGKDPGPIDNRRLQTHGACMLPGRDYHGVVPEVWDFFKDRYGGGPAIERAAVDFRIGWERHLPCAHGKCGAPVDHPPAIEIPRVVPRERSEEHACGTTAYQSYESQGAAAADFNTFVSYNGMTRSTASDLCEEQVERICLVLQDKLQEKIQGLQDSLCGWMEQQMSRALRPSQGFGYNSEVLHTATISHPGTISSSPSTKWSQAMGPTSSGPSGIHPESPEGWRRKDRCSDRSGTEAATGYSIQTELTELQSEACLSLSDTGSNLNDNSEEEPSASRAIWDAVYHGNVLELERQLNSGSHYDLKYTWPKAESLRRKLIQQRPLQVKTLSYKHRYVCCQAIHLAVAYKEDSLDKAEQDKKAKRMTELLLQARADVDARAHIPDKNRSEDRALQPVHLAAGVGNSKTLELLLESSADPNAEAKYGADLENTHYFPIHDAAWYDRVHCAQVLWKKGADLYRTNHEGSTALHLAAKLGYVKMAKWLLERTKGSTHGSHLSKCSDVEGRRPLDLAVEECQFPPGDLFLFTHDLDPGDQVQAFLRVARKCPHSAAELLRTRDEYKENCDLSIVPIDDMWRKALQLGARLADNFSAKQMQAEIQDSVSPESMKRIMSPQQKLHERQKIYAKKSDIRRNHGHVTVKVLADLVRKAPQAALDVVEALTSDPTVEDKQHNPLPNRAIVPGTNELSCLTCCYVDERRWSWQRGHDGRNKGMTNWQAKLAVKDARRGEEVSIKVVKLKGLIDVRLLQALAETSNNAIFTKLAIQGLLKEAWKHFVWMFVMSKVVDLMCAISVTLWTLGDWFGQPHRLLQQVCWHVVASHGLSQLFLVTWTCLHCFAKYYEEGTKVAFCRALFWCFRRGFRGILAMLTVALAYFQDPAEWPSTSQSILLAVNGIAHWTALLLELRAFEATGKRLLPIIKSSRRILGMVVIMIFVMIAFVTAFFALDRDEAEEIRAWEVMMLLFASSEFLERRSILPEFRGRHRWAIIAVLFLGVFIFTACVLNVFIAVLSDCYDIEQERMVCTFLRERSGILSGLFMRPHLQCFQRIWPRASRRKQACILFFTVMLPASIGLSFVLLVYMNEWYVNKWPSWISAWILALLCVLVQVVMRSLVTIGWDASYLWICYRKGTEERLNVPLDEFCHEDQGITSRLKRYVFDQRVAMQQSLERETQRVDAKVTQVIELSKQLRMHLLLSQMGETLTSSAEPVSSKTPRLPAVEEASSSAEELSPELAKHDPTVFHIGSQPQESRRPLGASYPTSL
mmetsp:Transcript_18950/g.44118  ORF Transcript_18950/g.44118 Transcript_18950/m.44118 type:complete len:1314 (+) Transcript_18950:125-4066(+)